MGLSRGAMWSRLPFRKGRPLTRWRRAWGQAESGESGVGGVNCNHLSRGDGALEVENSRVDLGKSEGPHPVRA